jgi:hypothetical protein
MGTSYVRPLKNAPFRPISVSGKNFKPQNTLSIPPVNPALAGFPSLNSNNIEHFSKAAILVNKYSFVHDDLNLN